MVRPLTLQLEDDTGLLKQVGLDITRGQLTVGTEVDPNKLTESRGVIVPGGLSVTEGLHSGVGGNNLVLKGHLTFLLLGSSDQREVLDDLLGVNSLTSTRL